MSPRHASSSVPERIPGLGSATREADEWTLRFEREYPHPIDQVFAMITDPALTRLWWADARIDGSVGGRFDLRWLNTPEAGEWWTGEILVWEPPTLVQMTNSEHGVLRWTLAATDAGTRLEFVDTIRPAEQQFVAMSLAGWHLHLEHLGAALDGDGQDWDAWMESWLPAWHELHGAYVSEYRLP